MTMTPKIMGGSLSRYERSRSEAHRHEAPRHEGRRQRGAGGAGLRVLGGFPPLLGERGLPPLPGVPGAPRGAPPLEDVVPPLVPPSAPSFITRLTSCKLVSPATAFTSAVSWR